MKFNAILNKKKCVRRRYTIHRGLRYYNQELMVLWVGGIGNVLFKLKSN